MSLRLNDLVIPDFANTEQAEAWGAQQKPETRDLVRSVYKSFEKLSLESSDLQRRVEYATDAQLIREAWQVIPTAELSEHREQGGRGVDGQAGKGSRPARGHARSQAWLVIPSEARS